MLTFLPVSSSNNFSTNLTGPNLNFTAATWMIALEQHLVADESLTILSHRVILFIRI